LIATEVSQENFMKRISRGRVLLALWSMIFVLIVPCAFAADRVRIGLSSFTPINAAVWIAEDKGLFKKYGIDPEVILIGAHPRAE
jgi:ABC-type nitrate/sulfonate/bicarbonate transport system substrate-binding protein